VFIESDLNFPFGLILLRQVRFKLRVTGFAHGNRFARISFYDLKATCHNFSHFIESLQCPITWPTHEDVTSVLTRNSFSHDCRAIHGRPGLRYFPSGLVKTSRPGTEGRGCASRGRCRKAARPSLLSRQPWSPLSAPFRKSTLKALRNLYREIRHLSGHY